MDEKRIGENIQNLRRRNNITLKELAEVVGVAYPTLSLYENGKSTPKIATLKKIADALNTTVATLSGDGGTELVSWHSVTPEGMANPASMSDILAYHDRINAAKDKCPDDPEAQIALGELAGVCAEIMKRLEEQSIHIRDLKSKLEYATALLGNKKR